MQALLRCGRRAYLRKREEKLIKKIIALIIAILLVLTFAACVENKEGNEKLQVVATLFPQYDFARIIGGDRAEVTKLLPHGVESHTYDPSVKDIVKISSADIFLYTGENMESWAAQLVTDASKNGTGVVDLSAGIALLGMDGEHRHQDGDGHNHDFDTHIWTSPKNAKIMVDTILSAYCEADSQNAEYYKQNAEKLKEELSEIDSALSALSESYDGRTLYFGGRFAFLYMFSEYGFQYRTPYKGCGEESEPGIKIISEITSEIKNSDTKYIFCEEMSEGKLARSIAGETGASVLVLHSCHNISKDEAQNGESYVSLMKKNIENLKTAILDSGS